jgi:nitric oxide reductase NorD protein
MNIYDKEGLYPGSAAFQNIENFAGEYRLSHITVPLEEVRSILETIVCGLSGRNLKIESAKTSYTDTNTIFLPATINHFNDPDLNYRFYKILTVHLWAQTWFGTFKRPNRKSPHISELLAQFEEPGRAKKLFDLLETFRLNACIKRELPGLGREMHGLHPTPKIHDSTWQSAIQKLETETATVTDTLEMTRHLYRLQVPWPATFLFQGDLNLDAAERSTDQRLEAEKASLEASLSDLLESMLNDGKLNQDQIESGDLDIEAVSGETGRPELTVDGEPMIMPPDLENLLSSIFQDLGDIPDDWLLPSSDSQSKLNNQKENSSDKIRNANSREEGAYSYDEWDYRRQTYRKNWCVLRELDAHPSYDDFTDRTLERYKHLVAEIRRHFEALRGEDKILRAQSVGDDIDLDALVTACADMKAGVEMSDMVYTQMRKQERDLAVVFMVDVSGSTKGWINDAERESLVLLCQALEILGDQYAVYGFSGMTRNRCEVYKIKSFDEPYNREVRARISGLRPKDYTRMGVVIRHLSKILNSVEAHTRILITLSDGKPDDYDGYRGDYGIEDTRQALLEARHTGIHPFCITIDTEAVDYLPHMYGNASYVVIDEVRKLPLKVADIYRKLTT